MVIVWHKSGALLATILTTAATLLGCVERPPCEVSFPKRQSPSDTVPLWRLQTHAHDGVPIATAWIGDARLSVVFDTGANVHLLGDGVVWYLGLPDAPPSEDGDGSPPRVMGAHGTVAQNMRYLAPVRVSMDLADIAGEHTFLAGPGDWFERAGAAGVLSPQRMVPEGFAIEINGPARTARVLSGAEREEAFKEATPLIPVCPSLDGVPLFAVETRIDSLPMMLIVDTGADVTFLSEDSAVARARANDKGRPVDSQSIDGVVTGRELDGHWFQIGRFGVKERSRISPTPKNEDCGVSGALGFNVLRHCSIVVERERGAIHCP